MQQTWHDCAAAARFGRRGRGPGIADRRRGPDRARGRNLAGGPRQPEAVSDAWLWLDARAAPTVRDLARGIDERARFEATGTGLNTCQQGSQMAHMAQVAPELLDRAEVALHCKDLAFLNLTGVRAADPSRPSATFGDFRNRRYSDAGYRCPWTGGPSAPLARDHRRF